MYENSTTKRNMCLERVDLPSWHGFCIAENFSCVNRTHNLNSNWIRFKFELRMMNYPSKGTTTSLGRDTIECGCESVQKQGYATNYSTPHAWWSSRVNVMVQMMHSISTRIPDPDAYFLSGVRTPLFEDCRWRSGRHCLRHLYVVYRSMYTVMEEDISAIVRRLPSYR